MSRPHSSVDVGRDVKEPLAGEAFPPDLVNRPTEEYNLDSVIVRACCPCACCCIRTVEVPAVTVQLFE
jgi:hypothetical protein